MSLEELMELIGINAPEEFEYFENFAEIAEYDDEIPADTLTELFSGADPETVSDVTNQYFEDIMESLTNEYANIYALLDTIKNVLCALIVNESETDENIELFAEELAKFHNWFAFDSSVECTVYGEDHPVLLSVRDALMMKRVGKLENEEHVFDFSACMDYEIDDYVLDLSSESRDRMTEEQSEDYLDNGYVLDEQF